MPTLDAKGHVLEPSDWTEVVAEELARRLARRGYELNSFAGAQTFERPRMTSTDLSVAYFATLPCDHIWPGGHCVSRRRATFFRTLCINRSLPGTAKTPPSRTNSSRCNRARRSTVRSPVRVR